MILALGIQVQMLVDTGSVYTYKFDIKSQCGHTKTQQKYK